MINEFESVRMEEVYSAMTSPHNTAQNRAAKRREITKDKIFAFYQRMT